MVSTSAALRCFASLQQTRSVWPAFARRPHVVIAFPSYQQVTAVKQACAVPPPHLTWSATLSSPAPAPYLPEPVSHPVQPQASWSLAVFSCLLGPRPPSHPSPSSLSASSQNWIPPGHGAAGDIGRRAPAPCQEPAWRGLAPCVSFVCHSPHSSPGFCSSLLVSLFLTFCSLFIFVVL